MSADFESLLNRLMAGNVEFVIIGGFAAFAHGVTLVTQDMDIACRFSEDNLLRLQAALRDLHPVRRLTAKRIPLQLTPQKCRNLKNLYLSTDWGVRDCLGEVKGLGGFDDVLTQSMEIPLAGERCRILTVSALIRAKEAMNRPRDREAVIQLRAIQEQRQLHAQQSKSHSGTLCIITIVWKSGASIDPSQLQ